MKIISWDIGIENLAYCIIEDKKIIKWNKIDILSDYRKDYKCMGLLKNTNMCNNYASFYSLCENKYYCKLHKKQGNECKEIIEHEICNSFNKSGKKCNIKANHILNNIYYCNKHNIEGTIPYYSIKNLPFFNKSKMLLQKLDNELDIMNVDEVVIENQPVYKNPIMKSIQMILYTYYLINMQKYNIKHIHLINATEKMKIYNGPIIECSIKDIHAKNKYLSKEYCKYFLQNDTNSLDYFNSFKKQDDIADTYLQGLCFFTN